ncbi:MAG: alkaline phosphatase [Planctomycetota bacterium]
MCVVLAGLQAHATPPGTGSVIFMHPDGASSATWAAARNYLVGPDHDLHWDRLPNIALYRGHMTDSLTGTSNGGATVHAYGVKVATDAYGTFGSVEDSGRAMKQPVDADGYSLSVAHQALRAGIPVGLVQTGTNTEPGTGCFVASVPSRQMHDAIATQLVDSGAAVILGGGEKFFVPEGVDGVHGPGARADGVNLVERAKERGYAVVYTRDELLALPEETDKVLGLFAEYHTFNDRPEEILEAARLPLYDPGAPSVAEMTEAALRVLGRASDQFLLVIEEEGTDNFGNNNNARGVLEACRRADEAFGVLRRYLENHPDTLVLTASDSDGGGMRLIGERVRPGQQPPRSVARIDDNGSPVDGRSGSGGAPFVAAADARGRTLPFRIQWAAQDDVSGAVLVRAEGLNAGLVAGSMDNTELAGLMRLTLFGTQRVPTGPALGE